MKLNKKLKTEKVERPMRPVYGLKRKHTICRITEIVNQNFPEFIYRVDCDDEPLFIREVEAVVGKQGWFYDTDLDLYYVTEGFKQEIVDLAQSYFSITVVDNGDGTLTTLKSTVNDGPVIKPE